MEPGDRRYVRAINRSEAVRELRRIVETKSWPRLVDLVEADWAELLFRHPGSLARALRTAPLAAAQSVRILAIRELLDVRPPVRMLLPPGLTDEQGRAVARSASARPALELNLAAMVLLRRRGEDERAAAFADQLDLIRLGIGVIPAPR